MLLDIVHVACTGGLVPLDRGHDVIEDMAMEDWSTRVAVTPASALDPVIASLRHYPTITQMAGNQETQRMDGTLLGPAFPEDPGAARS